MFTFYRNVAACFGAFIPFTLATSIPHLLKRVPADVTSLSPSVSTVQGELGPLLSKNASIYFPNNPNFAVATERWSAAIDASFIVVVVPGVEKDVATTVAFANKYSVPFLAVSRGHGTAAALSNVKHGINIHLGSLNSIDIAPDGNSAMMGGGTFVDEVIQTLSAAGKISSSGACACVGMMGPGLGGGLGRYGGRFGLVSDNIINLNVVIADGSLITVSESSHSDLFWGMRGAGHNFGIVTSFDYKIYDQPVVNWFFQNLIFTGDKLEAFFTQLNILGANGAQPVEVGLSYTLFAMDPAISTEPVIIFTMNFAGTQAQAEPLLAPFLALNPVVANNETVPYTGASHAGGAGVDDPICQDGDSWILFPVGLEVYNVTATRAVYTLFSTMIAENPKLNGSIVQFEGYSLQAVKAVDPASTAYPHRGDNLLVSYGIGYPGSDGALDAVASTYGHKARALFHAGSPGYPLNTYVNYASSDETPEELYGYEPWRLARLRALKTKYDPQGKFNFYNPING